MTKAVPFLGQGANPLRLYLRGERIAEVGIIDALRDAAADAKRRINALEQKQGVGSIVRRAQLAIIRRELRAVQDDIWKAVNKNVRKAGPAVGDAAAEAERVLQALLFQAVGQRESEALVNAQRAYARRTVATFLARGENGIGLSQRVYRTRQLANGFVDRAINRVILQGGGWQDLAKAVTPMINPDTPGGVSYAAKRLARTELNNAFHTTQRASAEINPFVRGLRWNLSRSHPKPDPCDALAAAGVFEPAALPAKPHPQCLCFMTNETVSDDEFLGMVMEEDFVDDLVDEYNQKSKSNVVQLPTKKPTPPRPQPKPKTGEAALRTAPLSLTSDKLNFDQRSRLRDYKGVGYTPTNTYLRRGAGEFFKDQIEELDELFDKSKITSDVEVYRGIENPRAVFGDRIDRDLTGLEWIEEAYLSTSADRRIAEGFAGQEGAVMRIRVPKGAPMIKLSEMGEKADVQHEGEMLGGRGWRLRATGHSLDDSGRMIIDVEVFNHGRNGQDPWRR